jgi:hypothetical protein
MERGSDGPVLVRSFGPDPVEPTPNPPVVAEDDGAATPPLLVHCRTQASTSFVFSRVKPWTTPHPASLPPCASRNDVGSRGSGDSEMRWRAVQFYGGDDENDENDENDEMMNDENDE